MARRALTREERCELEARGCHAEDWSRVTVAEDFSPGRSFHHVVFSGTVALGRYRGSIRNAEGFVMEAGIADARLHDVSVGDDCLISHSTLSSVDVGDKVLLLDVGAVHRTGTTPFGNGEAAHVLAEDGARSVPLWRRLSSQFAHLICHLKNHSAGDRLEALVRKDIRELGHHRCIIAAGCRIRRVRELVNVWISEGAVIDGAARLADCFLDSRLETPVRIGDGVIASKCVFLPGCRVDAGVQLKNCLVGEGVLLDSGFSGKHSLFFANSEFSLGEAACAMAGPYTVSHHKATLILTCQASFNTFGSGANSSNHHFKLGPIHGGVLRRGTRCGSGSYLFWPSDIGAFSSVVGKHSVHLDTAVFPFSLVVARGETSVLVPGVNLFTCGSFRDALKWRERDRRRGISDPHDIVNPAILSPYVLQSVEKAVRLLEDSATIGGDLAHGGAVIPARRVEPGLRLYRAALIFHMGERLLRRAADGSPEGRPSCDDILAVITGATSEEENRPGGCWRDWGGMLLSGERAVAYLGRLAAGEFSGVDEARKELLAIHQEYEGDELAWLAWCWLERYGQPTPESIVRFAGEWRKAVRFRYDCFLKDAGKEFSREATMGFGIEGEAEEAFRRVRGILEEHPLVKAADAERDGLLNMAKAIPHP